jgi:hypothetical protein
VSFPSRGNRRVSPKKNDQVAPPPVEGEWHIRFTNNDHGSPTCARSGRLLPRRQIEVTGGDRVWYLLDVEKHTVWVDYAGAHPKATE